MDIQNKIKELKNKIEDYNYAYYVLNEPKITDKEFDDLLNSLKELESQHPELITPDSPTQRVGGMAESSFKPVAHSIPMLSLENVYSKEEFEEWWNRLEKNLGKDEKIEVAVEPKMDGVSLSLTYENGILVRAATRGDGMVGEDVTANARTIRSIPLKLYRETSFFPKQFEARGEVYFLKKDFELTNHKLIQKNLKPFANPRNAASGSLRQKDVSMTLKRNLQFCVHSLGALSLELKISTHSQFIATCKAYHLPTLSNGLKIAKNAQEVWKIYEEWFNLRTSLPYEIDGLVIKFNSLHGQKLLGETAKSPRWAVAFKFQAHQAKTKILSVEFSVGRTGTVTPVAKVEPVECGGVTISSISLHNFDEIERLEVQIGDSALIERAGDVIPKVIRVLEHDKSSKKITAPKKCPSCSETIFNEEGEVALRCLNPSCPEQLERSLLHYASRDAMNIEGLGEAIVHELLQKKLVQDFSELYKLKKEDLLKCNLFKEKKSENLLKQIEESKSRAFSKLLFGLSIRHVGEKLSKILAEHFTHLKNLMKASEEQLLQIEECGPIIARSILNFFKSSQTKKLIEKLEIYGVNFTEPKISYQKSQLTKKIVVFTGELSSLSRSQAEELLIQFGGSPSSLVTKNTDLIVCGENPGSKLKKAKELGIPVIEEEEFLKLVNKNVNIVN
ncbi:MAG: NAD-dependent DNA ligase LigA [Elusimicrobia bacterium]|nr:NAD-dependent DNA ligase LigA [Elusimicrobiota bacterium]